VTVPRVFGLPHLSEDAVAAFADGVLTPAATARARRHCAECGECAEAVRGQREAAMMLRMSAPPALPSGLLDRLAGLPMSASLPPPRSGLPTTLGSDGIPVFVAHDPRNRAQDAPRSDGHHDRVAAAPDSRAGHHRRGLLPVTMLASVAAVVAAGTLGGNVAATDPSNDQSGAAASVPFAANGVVKAVTGRHVDTLPAAGLLATSLEQPARLRQSGSLAQSGSVVQSGSVAEAATPERSAPLGSVALPVGVHRRAIPAP